MPRNPGLNDHNSVGNLCEKTEGLDQEKRREEMQRPDDRQAGFEDWALAQRTRPNEVLEKINALVDLSEAQKRLEATYSELGRPGHRAAILLRVMLLQHLYGVERSAGRSAVGRPVKFPKVRRFARGRSSPGRKRPSAGFANA